MNDLCDEVDKETLHLHSIEDMIYGLDINQHAINIGASALTLIAPNVDYNKMNLYCMQHGKNSDGEVRTGSLDLLIDDHRLNVFGSSGMRTSSDEFIDDRVKLDNSFDLVIMNPPYTRNDLRNQHYPSQLKKEIQQREVFIAKEIESDNELLSDTINQSTIATFFFPLADKLLNNSGTIATVLPLVASVGTAGKGVRNLLTNQNHFILELVISSHDNNRVYFSGNTGIHECLLIVKRPTSKNKNKNVAFVSLYRNPNNISQALDLAESIKKALNGNSEDLNEKYGTISYQPQSSVRGRTWNFACFYDTSLAKTWNDMSLVDSLVSIKDIAKVEPGGQRVRDAFKKSQIPHSKKALWNHKSDIQKSLLTAPDTSIIAKNGKERLADKYWNMKSHLLIVNKFGWKTFRVTSVFTSSKILGSAFCPIKPLPKYSNENILKAWCLYLNSTFGILALLNTRGKDLKYSHHSLDSLRNILIPHPKCCDIDIMAHTFDEICEKELNPIFQINNDTIRAKIDDCVFKAVPGLFDAKPIRDKIANEPSVHQRKK